MITAVKNFSKQHTLVTEFYDTNIVLACLKFHLKTYRDDYAKLPKRDLLLMLTCLQTFYGYQKKS